MKQCTKCKIEKDEKEFSKHKNKPSGLQPYCKSCRALIDKKYNSERKQLLDSTDWSDINLHEQAVFNVFFGIYKREARNRKYSFELSYEQFADLTQRPCKYCGRYPTLSAYVYRGVCVVNGIDRIDNSLGYIPENCVPCCTMCNYMKGALSIDEWNDFIFRLVNNNKHLLVA